MKITCIKTTRLDKHTSIEDIVYHYNMRWGCNYSLDIPFFSIDNFVYYRNNNGVLIHEYETIDVPFDKWLKLQLSRSKLWNELIQLKCLHKQK